MQGEVDGLWGPTLTLEANTSHSLDFEDSFSPQEIYVPLQDSQQYLAGLESKLAGIQGRTASTRKTESRRLLDALAGSRSTHTAQLLQDTDTSCSSLPIMDAAPSSSTIDPQGALGAMLRRVAPDRVALTPEELCHLLQADLLAHMHEAEEEARSHNLPSGSSSEDQDRAPSNLPQSVEPREHSSDEGEK